MEYHGYAGKILRIDLSTRKIEKEPLSRELIEGYLGGAGMQYRIIYDLLQPDMDPYSPQAPVIVGTGPLTGTLAPLNGKVFVTAKSPAFASKRERKHFISFSASGSKRFGAMLKNAGYDHAVITGRADRPSYLKIIDDDIDICDAADLWGNKGIYQTSEELAARHRGATGPAGIWTIGKAGENLVRYSRGVVDMQGSLGTHGIAAVLGSKNLKAVVALGTRGIKVADPTGFMKVTDRIWHDIVSHPRFHEESVSWVPPDGTSNTESNGMPSGGRGMRSACMACPANCKFVYQVKDGRFAGERLRVSYLTLISSVGRRFGLDHYGDSVRLVNLINDYGLDKTTMEGMLVFLTRLYERGVINSDDTGGLELKFGDFEAYSRLLDKVVSREDIGEYMASGWYPLIQKVGVDASADFEDGCPIVKGVTVMTDARHRGFIPTTGLSAIVSGSVKLRHGATYWPPGEDIHRDTYFPQSLRSLNDLKRDMARMGATEEELERMFTKDDFNASWLEKVTEDGRMACDLLGVCDNCHGLGDPMRDLQRLSELYLPATGLELSPSELRQKGEKVCNLEKILNVREGFTRKDDVTPSIWLQNVERPMRSTRSNRFTRGESHLHDYFDKRLSRNDIHKTIDDYYEKRGWDIDRGIPTKEKLMEVGLGEFSDIMEAAINE
ncbi:MAG: aldehyde ferredoxin oxidoreductase N-terminal domain-containing protein [Dehalococcoidales bacterium]|jgi:aldehyde:ferredoxin oxidoreductase